MWKSWGDKYEIIPYDAEKRPRKLKKVKYIVAILPFVCLLPLLIIQRPVFNLYISSLLALLSAIVCLVLFLLKWIKNDKECDFSLMTMFVLFVFWTYALSPVSNIINHYQIPVL